MNHDHPQKSVTVEQLIRLKRAERPSPEFWADFDRAIRTKQLAAIVEPRPWWAPFIRIGARVSRYQVPVGATAIFALTFLTVSEYRGPESEPVFAPSAAQAVQSTAMRPMWEEVASREQTAPTVENLTSGGPELVVAETVARTGVVQTESPVAPTSLPGGARASAVADSFNRPSAQAIAANLEAVKASEPEIARMLDYVPGLRTQQLETRTPPVDPLMQVPLPGESNTRVRRLLASALPASAPAEDMSTQHEQSRVGRSLSDDRLYERLGGRFDVASERLAINIRL